ncbi:MAG TPA: methyltransferase domain-containing protein [Alphaproteobacteria bacterium]|nr:methyltransferase domain-containing protein [Alphaproteobacteria bacterium]
MIFRLPAPSLSLALAGTMTQDANAHEEYGDDLVALLQLIWGEGFMTPGGASYIHTTIAGRDLSGKLLLDIGSGLGGHDIVLAKDYGAEVVGIDIEPGLVKRARHLVEREGLAGRIRIELVTPGPLPFPAEMFDVVYSSGALTQIANKKGMFLECFRVLKPGGSLLFYDWMKAPGPYSADMLYFFKMEGLTYAMDTLEAHGALLADAGFTDIELEDATEEYRRDARAELEMMKGALRPKMVQLLGPDTAKHFVEDWRSMTVVLDKGEMRPGRYRARKPV